MPWPRISTQLHLPSERARALPRGRSRMRRSLSSRTGGCRTRHAAPEERGHVVHGRSASC
jgi:hypothetical protein